jgi:hypothetical protein
MELGYNENGGVYEFSMGDLCVVVNDILIRKLSWLKRCSGIVIDESSLFSFSGKQITFSFTYNDTKDCYFTDEYFGLIRDELENIFRMLGIYDYYRRYFFYIELIYER